jgi:hypothetical protein
MHTFCCYIAAAQVRICVTVVEHLHGLAAAICCLLDTILHIYNTDTYCAACSLAIPSRHCSHHMQACSRGCQPGSLSHTYCQRVQTVSLSAFDNTQVEAVRPHQTDSALLLHPHRPCIRLGLWLHSTVCASTKHSYQVLFKPQICSHRRSWIAHKACVGIEQVCTAVARPYFKTSSPRG